MSQAEPWEFTTLKDAEAWLDDTQFDKFLLASLVDSQWVLSDPNDPCVDMTNPKTGKTIGRIPVSSEDKVNAAVEVAEGAFPSWSTTPASKRSQHLLQIASLIEERKEIFAVWESIDQGKTLPRARAEVDRAISNFRYLPQSYSEHGLIISDTLLPIPYTRTPVLGGRMTIFSLTSIAHHLASSRLSRPGICLCIF